MKALNYRIIVEKEKQGKDSVYVAYAPSLGLSDFGKTIDQAVANIEQAIELYLETLIELKEPMPQPDTDEYYVTSTKIQFKVPA